MAPLKLVDEADATSDLKRNSACPVPRRERVYGILKPVGLRWEMPTASFGLFGAARRANPSVEAVGLEPESIAAGAPI